MKRTTQDLLDEAMAQVLRRLWVRWSYIMIGWNTAPCITGAGFANGIFNVRLFSNYGNMCVCVEICELCILFSVCFQSLTEMKESEGSVVLWCMKPQLELNHFTL